ncbi:MAG: histidine kinase dimerization/phosphoacceptor domain -containing protein [Thermodesulfobacteriota bacterium]
MKFTSIKTRIGVAFLLLLIAPFVIGMIVVLAMHERMLRERAIDDAKTLAHTAYHIQHEIEMEMIRLAQQYARLKSISILLPLGMGDKIGRELNRIYRSDQLDLVTVTDAHLRVVARAHAPDVYEDTLPTKAYFHRTALGETIVFIEVLREPELKAECVPKERLSDDLPDGNVLSLTAVAPIQPIVQEPPLGFILIRKLLSAQQTFTRPIANTLHVNSALYFQGYRVVLSRSPTHDPPLHDPSEDSVRKALVSNEEVTEIAFRKNGHTTALVPLKDFQGDPVAVLMVQTSVISHMDIRRTAWWISGSIAAVMVVFVVLLLRTIERNLVQPIQRLNRHIESFSESFDWRMEAPSPAVAVDEIGMLYQSIAKMTQALPDALERLRQENFRRRQTEEALLLTIENMERRIEERTADIHRINEVLTAEIAERKRSEAQYRSALAEKEVLLLEIHHRVKNNLQIISSLLDMTRNRSKDPRVIEALTAARNKIYAMSLINAQLYQSNRFDRIDMHTFIRNLTASLGMLSTDYRQVTYRIDAENFFMSVTHANPVALILNEILSNCLKHAFVEQDDGIIDISLRREGAYNVLTVSDNGRGLPKDIDVRETQTLGLKLVRNLVLLQLKGRLSIRSAQGTIVTVTFPRADLTEGEFRS